MNCLKTTFSRILDTVESLEIGVEVVVVVVVVTFPLLVKQILLQWLLKILNNLP